MSQYKSTVERRKTGLIYWDMDWSSGLYTLYTPQTGNGLVKLIDITGETVHEWNMPVRPGRDAVILPNGNLGYNGSHKESANLYPAWDIWHGGHFMQMNPKGDIVWEHEDIYHHHDAQWLENGNLLYAAATSTPSRWEIGISDIIKEVNRKGEVVWEWKVWEHLRQVDYPIHECFNTDHWPMVNGLHQTEDGLILFIILVLWNMIRKQKNWFGLIQILCLLHSFHHTWEVFRNFGMVVILFVKVHLEEYLK